MKQHGAHVVECDSVNKETFHDKWSTEDDTKVDYKANLQKGLYNYGLCKNRSLTPWAISRLVFRLHRF
jgi:hypothetical protein